MLQLEALTELFEWFGAGSFKLVCEVCKDFRCFDFSLVKACIFRTPLRLIYVFVGRAAYRAPFHSFSPYKLDLFFDFSFLGF